MNKYVIIGAGILGASTAYHLTKQGAKVVIVDREHVGQATEAAAGIVCPWLTKRRNNDWYRLVTGGAAYYPSLVEMLKEDGETETGYAQVGAINIFSKEEMLNNKMKVALERKERNPEMGEITKLNIEETNELFPLLAPEYGAVHISGGARVNGAALRDALIRAAVKNGATYIKGEATLVKKGNRLVGASVHGETIYADAVIVAAGAWGKQLLEPIDVHIPISYEKAQIVHLHIPNNIETKDWPVVMPPFGQYFLTFAGGKIVIGATAEHLVQDTRVTIRGVHEIMNKALKVAPGFASCMYVQTKVGFRPFIPQSTPVAYPVPNIDNLYVANGLGASGLTAGPFLGKELAHSILELPTEIDMSLYARG
ncbi:NAD(P)/FAD-dependent oxidoreductase [Pontibacillus litoralis]|uniref:Oxidoreductase n=1 Tax=Pontibacillus litoralis JSM 072002 TaxID=1385512 RepID=A0A0A5G3B8_9BACI|nr:FAD-binding oxidoreductase [Pontibacillus litoralis]KGX85570.1 oxidoreductase [Pontibacillus litoralis JSM 072002]